MTLINNKSHLKHENLNKIFVHNVSIQWMNIKIGTCCWNKSPSEA